MSSCETGSSLVSFKTDIIKSFSIITQRNLRIVYLSGEKHEKEAPFKSFAVVIDDGGTEASPSRF